MVRSIMAGDGFMQDPPRLGNQYTDDEFLRSQMQRNLPQKALQVIGHDLERFGWDVATRIKALGFQAEAEPPLLQSHDAWGKRIDLVVTSLGWQKQKEVSAKEGLIANAYERAHGQYSRMHQVAKLLLYGASSGLFNCPLAMTDGAARVCEQSGSRLPQLLDAFRHLTSRDPSLFWTSGQWMTEKAGGSDVAAATETVAVAEGEGRGVGSWYRLHGYKWFTSAADGEMAFALGRECSLDGDPIPGNKGLSMFFVPIERDEEGRPQGFEVVKLKNKLGTKQLPTAELRLKGMRALKVSEVGRGVPSIATMVSITRVHNSAAAVSFMRRITALAHDYARRRHAFGAPLSQQPLALCTLAWMELHTCACTALLLEAARLLGVQECGKASPAELSLLRLLTPLAKLFTAKEAVAVCSEGVEFFGGQGYIEDTHLPGMLRDAQVLAIWEGTTNVLSLDLLRVLGGDQGAASAFLDSCDARLAAATAAAAAGGNSAAVPAETAAAGRSRGEGGGKGAEGGTVQGGQQGQRGGKGSRVGRVMHAELLARVCAAVGGAVRGLEGAVRGTAAPIRGAGHGAGLPEGAQAGARDLALAMTRAFVGVLLAEHAAWSGSPRHVLLASEWCREVLSQQQSHLPQGTSPDTLSMHSGNSVLALDPSLDLGEGGGDGFVPGRGSKGVDARVAIARVIAGVDQPLSQPRAKF